MKSRRFVYLRFLTVPLMLVGLGYGWVALAYRFSQPYRHESLKVPVDVARTLNQTKPTVTDYQQLVDLYQHRRLTSRRRLRRFAEYYQRVTEYWPHSGHAFGLLGFCQYHLGEREAAKQSYQQAAERDPRFFWSHFNLAITAIHDQDWPLAELSLKKALLSRPQHTINKVMSSPMLYQPIIAVRGADMEILNRELNLAYQQAAVLLKALQDAKPHTIKDTMGKNLVVRLY